MVGSGPALAVWSKWGASFSQGLGRRKTPNSQRRNGGPDDTERSSRKPSFGRRPPAVHWGPPTHVAARAVASVHLRAMQPLRSSDFRPLLLAGGPLHMRRSGPEGLPRRGSPQMQGSSSCPSRQSREPPTDGASFSDSGRDACRWRRLLNPARILAATPAVASPCGQPGRPQTDSSTR